MIVKRDRAALARLWRAAVCAVLVLAIAPSAAHAALTSRAGRTPAPVAEIARLGPASPGTQLRLALPLRADVAGLMRLAQAVSTPGSAQYGRYQSLGALTARYGAAPAERRRVVSYLRRAGATGVRVDVTGLFVDATISVARARRLFGAGLTRFAGARAARFTAPSGPVRIPAALRPDVTGVVGLDTAPVFGTPAAELPAGTAWPRLAARAQSPGGSGQPVRSGTAAGCGAATSQTGFTPNQYLTAYGYAPLQAAGLEGQGERVAVIEIDGFRYSDLRAFAACFGLSIPQIDGFGVGLRRPLAPGGESTLDLEVLDAAAPRLKSVDVYESRPSAVDVLHALTAPLADPNRRPDVISASLGACEPATLQAIGPGGLRAVEGSLALAAASGITVLAASGDDGSSACLTPSGRALPDLAVSYPASSPFVTGVGGSAITLNAANQLVGQQAWNDAPVEPQAGGGGQSGLFGRPTYQRAVLGGGGRGVPDVSMLADVAPGYEIHCTARPDCLNSLNRDPWTQVGGTSAAAPLLAGGLALVDQGLRRQGRQSLGLVNPLLYDLDRSAAGPSVISDIAAGDNDLGAMIAHRPLGCCTAQPGYDEATGLGSVDLAALAAVVPGVVAPIPMVTVTLPRQAAPVRHGRLVARVACTDRCLVRASVRLGVAGSPTLLTANSAVYLLRRTGARTLGVPLGSATAARLSSALRRRRQVTASVTAVVLDPGGSIEARSAPVVLKIRG